MGIFYGKSDSFVRFPQCLRSHEKLEELIQMSTLIFSFHLTWHVCFLNGRIIDLKVGRNYFICSWHSNFLGFNKASLMFVHSEENLRTIQRREATVLFLFLELAQGVRQVPHFLFVFSKHSPLKLSYLNRKHYFWWEFLKMSEEPINQFLNCRTMQWHKSTAHKNSFHTYLYT